MSRQKRTRKTSDIASRHSVDSPNTTRQTTYIQIPTSIVDPQLLPVSASLLVQLGYTSLGRKCTYLFVLLVEVCWVVVGYLVVVGLACILGLGQGNVVGYSLVVDSSLVRLFIGHTIYQ